MMTALIVSFALGQPLESLPLPPSKSYLPLPPSRIEPLAEPPQPVTEWVVTLPYAEAVSRAGKEWKPVVIFISTPSRNVPGCLTTTRDSLGVGYPEKCVVVAVAYTDGVLRWHGTLATNATDAEIWRAVNEGQVKAASPSPFPLNSAFSRPERPTADGEGKAAGPWPKHLTFLRDLEPYTTAQRTQQSFRRWSGVIGSAPRSSVEEKWNVAGGLVGVHGWSNQLLKKAKFSVYLGRQDPNDEVSTITWQRSYEDGSIFADILRNSDGKVFEVRVAEKEAGKWSRYVAYVDASARPHGYKRLTVGQCAECHRQAGASAYGAGAVPGGDQVFSDPIHDVENGRVIQGGFGTRL